MEAQQGEPREDTEIAVMAFELPQVLETTGLGLGHEAVAYGGVIVRPERPASANPLPTAAEEEPRCPQDHPDCERCGMPAEIEVKGTPMCRGCYGEIMSP
jgi:hypothetical protein